MTGIAGFKVEVRGECWTAGEFDDRDAQRVGEGRREVDGLFEYILCLLRNEYGISEEVRDGFKIGRAHV